MGFNSGFEGLSVDLRNEHVTTKVNTEQYITFTVPACS